MHASLLVSPSLSVISERLGLRRLLPAAVDRAVAEIISPVVDRSVTIACMTTQASAATWLLRLLGLGRGSGSTLPASATWLLGLAASATWPCSVHSLSYELGPK